MMTNGSSGAARWPSLLPSRPDPSPGRPSGRMVRAGPARRRIVHDLRGLRPNGAVADRPGSWSVRRLRRAGRASLPSEPRRSQIRRPAAPLLPLHRHDRRASTPAQQAALRSGGGQPPDRVPPSWFRTTLAACSARRLAGLLHPAADHGVHRVSCPVHASMERAVPAVPGPWVGGAGPVAGPSDCRSRGLPREVVLTLRSGTTASRGARPTRPRRGPWASRRRGARRAS